MTITLWEAAHFKMRALASADDIPDVRPYGFNDIVSAIEVSPGEEWEVFEHINYTGRKWRVRAGRHGWIPKDLGIQNDCISSIRRVKPAGIAGVRGGITRVPSSIAPKLAMRIAAQSKGMDNGNAAEILVDGKDVAPGKYRRGLNVAVLNEVTGRLEWFRAFDTWETEAGAEAFADAMETVPSGRVVVIAIRDEGSAKMTDRARKALRTLGAARFDEVEFRDAWALIGWKGAKPGACCEGLARRHDGWVTVHAGFVPAAFELDARLADAWRALEARVSDALEAKAAVEKTVSAARSRLKGLDADGSALTRSVDTARSAVDAAGKALAKATAGWEAAERLATRRARDLQDAEAELDRARASAEAAARNLLQAETGRDAATFTATAEGKARAEAEALLEEQARLRKLAVEAVQRAEAEETEASLELKRFMDAWAGDVQSAVNAFTKQAREDREKDLARMRAEWSSEKAEAVAKAAETAAMERESAVASVARWSDARKAADVAAVARKAEASIRSAVADAEREMASPGVREAFATKLALEDSPLNDLLDTPPTVLGRAMEAADGRKVRVVLGVVRDGDGRTASGILVRLLSDREKLVDQSRTNAAGVVLLRFPQKMREKGAVVGALEIAGNEKAPHKVAFRIPEESQHAVASVVLDELPEDRSRRGDDPLERTPVDFTPGLFDDLVRLMGDRPDPFLDEPGEDGKRFPAKRGKVIRRMSAARVGPPRRPGLAPRRYVVNLHQEWVFAGYSLGEIADMQDLSPGETLREASTVAESTKERTMEEVNRAVNKAMNTVESVASRVSNVDNLVASAANATNETSASTTTETESTAVGASVSIPFVASASAGYSKNRVSTNSHLKSQLTSSSMSSSKTNASQQANSMMKNAQSTVNNQMKSAVAALKSVESKVNRTLDRVSPLLSRVTNLLKWTVYENYLVCTRVEDVKEVVVERVTSVASMPGQLFSVEDILEYERLFAPAILNVGLLPEFANIRRTLESNKALAKARKAAERAREVALREREEALRERRDVMRLMTARRQRAEPALPEWVGNLQHFAIPGVEDAMRKMLEDAARKAQKKDAEDTSLELPPVPPMPPVVNLPDPEDPNESPLVAHVNRNRTYYFGLLLEAALHDPSLRDDAPHLRHFNGDHPIWRLPVLGFEGDKALVLRDPKASDAYATDLLADPGSATLVQIAAPGAYSEAIQGLKELSDLKGKIPPSLQPPIHVVPGDFKILDLASKATNGNGGAPTDALTSTNGATESLPKDPVSGLPEAAPEAPPADVPDVPAPQ